MKKKPAGKNKKRKNVRSDDKTSGRTVFTNPEIFETIIVGAGPVGLIFAKELAKNHRVLLVEKEKTIVPRKSWAVPKEWAIQAGYGAYLTNTITKGGFYSHLGNFDIVQAAPQEFFVATIDEDKLYQDLLRDLKTAGCQVLANTEVQSYKHGDGFIEIKSGASTFKGRLLLDCSGVDSPFIKRGDNFKHEFYWSAYGQTYIGAKTDPARTTLAHIGNYKGDKLWINDVPEGKGRYTPWLFIVSPQKYSLDELKGIYPQAVKGSFLKDRLSGHRPCKEKSGWISAADVRSHAQDRILSLGDAGAFGPWQNGMSFSLMLKKLKIFVSRLEDRLAENSLDEKSLNQVVKLDDEEELNFDLGKFFFLFMMNSRDQELKRFFQSFLGDDSFKRVAKLLSLDASLEDFKVLLTKTLDCFSATEIFKILGRDGWADEIKIGSEVISDFIKNLI